MVSLVDFLMIICNFRASDEVNKELMEICNKSRRMHMTPAVLDGKYSLRLVVMDEYCNDQHIEEVWSDIQRFARRVLVRRNSELYIGKQLELGDNFHIKDFFQEVKSVK